MGSSWGDFADKTSLSIKDHPCTLSVWAGAVKLLLHLLEVCGWRFNHLRGQSLIPSSYHAPPHTTLLCVKQNPGLRPMQMAIIWWLTALVFIMLRGNRVFLSFTEDWMNYPVVSLSLSSSSSSSSPSSFWSQSSDTCPEKIWGRETRWPQVQEDWRHSDNFVSCDSSAPMNQSQLWQISSECEDAQERNDLSLWDADFCCPDCQILISRAQYSSRCV